MGGSVFNAFNARYYQSDVFYSYEPRLEFLPNPWARNAHEARLYRTGDLVRWRGDGQFHARVTVPL